MRKFTSSSTYIRARRDAPTGLKNTYDLMAAIKSFDNDPPDSDFQEGHLDGLLDFAIATGAYKNRLVNFLAKGKTRGK